jgi:N-acetyl sugar amidotransferase
VARIKESGQGKKYDCILGLSGGVDSSYVALIAKQHGLRPLCVHFDNGWNSEIAVRNIHNIVNTLGFDLETYVIDWEEFKDLQLAYLKASVIDIEVVTDHAIYSVIYRLALRHGINYVLSGQNIVTEGVLPSRWGWNIKDFVNIKAIHKAFGQKPLRSYPLLSRSMKKQIAKSGIETVEFLNWMPYRKAEAIQTLQHEVGWLNYGNKHHESIWTRFFQVYILPRKFGVDKRKAHYSNLICSGQMTKEQALSKIEKPAYDPALLEQDKKFVLKKLGLTEAEFEAMMAAPPRSHKDFDTEGSLFHYYPVLKPLRPLWEQYKRIMKKDKGLVQIFLLLTVSPVLSFPGTTILAVMQSV